MKKIILTLAISAIASLLLASAAFAGTLDNLQVQIDKNQATINLNSTPKTAPAPAPATTTKKDDDGDDHKDNGKHLGEKKKGNK